MGSGLPDDHYALIGIPANATAAELRRAFRRLALQWHPDRAGAGATATFQRILAAYTVLADPIARANYDRRRGVGGRPPRAAPGVMLHRLSGPLQSLLMTGAARHGEAGMLELILNAAEAAQGGMITIAMRVPIRCPACASDRTAPCDRCGNNRTINDLFSAWLAVPPDAADGDILVPSAMLPGMIRPISFRIRIRGLSS